MFSPVTATIDTLAVPFQYGVSVPFAVFQGTSGEVATVKSVAPVITMLMSNEGSEGHFHRPVRSQELASEPAPAPAPATAVATAVAAVIVRTNDAMAARDVGNNLVEWNE